MAGVDQQPKIAIYLRTGTRGSLSSAQEDGQFSYLLCWTQI